MEQITIMKETIENPVKLIVHWISKKNKENKFLISDCKTNLKEVGNTASLRKELVNCEYCLSDQRKPQRNRRDSISIKLAIEISNIRIDLNRLKIKTEKKFGLLGLFLKKKIPGVSYGINNHSKKKNKPVTIKTKFALFKKAVYRVVFSYFDALRNRVITKTVKITGFDKKERFESGKFKFKEYFHSMNIFNVTRIA